MLRILFRFSKSAFVLIERFTSNYFARSNYLYMY